MRFERSSRLRRALVGRLPPRARQLINAQRGIDQPLVVPGLPAQRVIVFAPHPDDEVIGCGGALHQHVVSGAVVTVVFVTSGERTWSMTGSSPGERRERREREARAALTVLGLDAAHARFWRIPDGGIESDAGLASRVSALFDELDPDLVYAPWPLDAHRDHRALTATVAQASNTPARVALYEVWGPLVPTHIVDVTASMDTKVRALSSYEGALSGIDYRHTVRGLAAYRSGQGMGGKGYAEAFCVVSPDQCAVLSTHS